MARSLLSSQRVFPVVLAVTLAVGMLPGSALRWTRFPAELFRIAVMPFAEIGNRVGQWLRPDPYANTPKAISPELVEHLEQQVAEYERLYYAEQTKVEALEKQLSQLQGFPASLQRVPVKTIGAHVGMRSANSAHGAVVLNRGSSHGVHAGAVAVYNHVHLMGRVVGDVSAVQSTLLPLTNASIGALQGSVVTRDRSGAAVSLPHAPVLHLTSTDDGSFIAEPHKTDVINVGDEVILNDPNWPQSAQGMKIGLVEHVKPNDRQPLRNTVIVRPQYMVSQVSFLALRVEVEDATTQTAHGARTE